MSDDMFDNGLDDEFDDDLLGGPDIFSFPGDVDSCVLSLTVAEGKRLIARGIAADVRVEGAMSEGMVAVCKGTTNGYVLEELLGRDVEKGKYVLGRTVPERNEDAQKAFEGDIPEVIFRKGEPVEGLTLADAVQEMTAGDVVLKGANALDYVRGVGAVLIGHPVGGTTATIMGPVYGKGLQLIIPVGLEKQIAVPMPVAASAATPPLTRTIGGPSLWPLQGIVFTEIEALAVLSGAGAVQIAAGGVCGAEGAVWLMVLGDAEDVEEAKQAIESVRDEKPFWEAVMGEE